MELKTKLPPQCLSDGTAPALEMAVGEAGNGAKMGRRSRKAAAMQLLCECEWSEGLLGFNLCSGMEEK